MLNSDESSNRGRKLDIEYKLTRTVDEPEKNTDAQGGRHAIRPTFRSVEQTKYKENHGDIFTMVTNQNSAPARKQAISQEPMNLDFHSNNWERRNSIKDPVEVSIDSPTRKKKILVKRKNDKDHSSSPTRVESRITLQPLAIVDNSSPSPIIHVNEGISPFRLDSLREQNLNDSMESPTRKPVKKMRIKKKTDIQIEK